MLTKRTKLSLAIMAVLSIGFAQAANAAIDFESVAVGSYSSFTEGVLHLASHLAIFRCRTMVMVCLF